MCSQAPSRKDPLPTSETRSTDPQPAGEGTTRVDLTVDGVAMVQLLGPQDRLLRTVVRQVQHLDRITSDLYTATQIHLGTLHVDVRPTLVGALVEELLQDLDDVAVEINVTPDRGYALSLRGVAREYSHATGAPFRDPADREVDEPGSGFPLAVVDEAPIRGRAAVTEFVVRTVRGVGYAFGGEEPRG